MTRAQPTMVVHCLSATPIGWGWLKPMPWKPNFKGCRGREQTGSLVILQECMSYGGRLGGCFPSYLGFLTYEREDEVAMYREDIVVSAPRPRAHSSCRELLPNIDHILLKDKNNSLSMFILFLRAQLSLL